MDNVNSQRNKEKLDYLRGLAHNFEKNWVPKHDYCNGSSIHWKQQLWTAWIRFEFEFAIRDFIP